MTSAHIFSPQNCFAHLESVAKLSQVLLCTLATVCTTQRPAIFSLLTECHHPVPHYATNTSLVLQAELSDNDVAKVLMCP